MTHRSLLALPARAALLAVVFGLASGCGWIKGMAIDNVASMLSQSGTTTTADDDPDLIGDAVPFALKLQESLLAARPNNGDLLRSTCALATQYGFAYLQSKAEILGEAHHDESKALRERAFNMYMRGKGYCVRALEERQHGITKTLAMSPEESLKRIKDKKDVELLYWSAASWGAAISLGKDKPEVIIDYPVVRALAAKALALDPTWNKGALYELMITLDSLPPALGGNVEQACGDFTKAVDLQKGLSPGPYVSLAMGVYQPVQNRDKFTKLINDALAIDPEKDPDDRLITLLTQKKARALLDQIDTLFAGSETDDPCHKGQ